MPTTAHRLLPPDSGPPARHVALPHPAPSSSQGGAACSTATRSLKSLGVCRAGERGGLKCTLEVELARPCDLLDLGCSNREGEGGVRCQVLQYLWVGARHQRWGGPGRSRGKEMLCL